MKKLSELLAVEDEARKAIERKCNQCVDMFRAPDVNLTGTLKQHKPDTGDPPDPETTPLITTVAREFEILAPHMSWYINMACSKELTTGKARSQFVIGDNKKHTVPLSFMAVLFDHVTQLESIVSAAPTLDKQKDWALDDDRGCFVSKPEETDATQKRPCNHLLAEATEHHPAQVQVFMDDVKVGVDIKQTHSGAMTPDDKQAMLDRIAALKQAIKASMESAKALDLVPANIGEDIVAFIFGK
jgi:hypothetical protein